MSSARHTPISLSHHSSHPVDRSSDFYIALSRALSTSDASDPRRVAPYVRDTLARASRAAEQLTARDHRVINRLVDLRVMTTDQLARVEFPNTRTDTAGYRLRTLARRGVLLRFRTLRRPGSLPWRYTLGPLGAVIHAATTGAAIPRPSDNDARVVRLQTSAMLDHLLGVAEFFSLLHAAARREAVAPLDWWPETRAATECGGIVRPDGYFVWSEHQRKIGYFYEHDRGTEVVPILVDKIERYLALAAADIRRPVVIELPSPARETHLHRALTARHGPRGPAVLVATTHTELTTTNGPAGPIWWPVGTRQRVQLTRLGSGQRL